MAEITRRRTGEFLRKLFGLLVADSSGVKASTLVEAVGNAFTLTEYEKGLYPSGGQRFKKFYDSQPLTALRLAGLRRTKACGSLLKPGREPTLNFKIQKPSTRKPVGFTASGRRSEMLRRPPTAHILQALRSRLPLRAWASPSKKPKNMPGDRSRTT